MKSLKSLQALLFLCSSWLAHAAPTPPPPASDFYVPLSSIPNFHPLSGSPPLHIWAGHLLAEPDNFIPPGPNETPHPNLPVQAHLYFVLLKARRTADKERTIFWFNGGPGCSSFDGLMMEVGPWRFDEHGELWQIDGGWEEYANIVYIDQPIGTGFSYGSTDKYLTELSDVPGQVMEFMRNFYKVFPELANQDTYIAGESFAGQYIPYIASALLKPNNVPMHVAGIAIGNGWIDSRVQYAAYVEFGLQAGLFTVNSPEHLRAKEAMDRCQEKINALPANEEPVGVHGCDEVMSAVVEPFDRVENGQDMCMNIYDMRLMDTAPACGMNWPPDLKQITPWLRRTSVIRALHAEHKDTAWIECSGRVGASMHNNHSPSAVTLLPGIAAKVPVLIFAGDQDIICNYVGQEMTLERMTWNGQTGMRDAEVLDWSVNGTAAGTWQIARNVSYVKIYQASHMVGFDLPHVAHDMMLRFMGVDFNVISEGTIGRIESSLGENEKEAILPGGGRVGDLERAKWEAYYNAGTVALIVVLIAVAIGTVLFCRSRRQARAARLMSHHPARDSYIHDGVDYANGHLAEESIPLTSGTRYEQVNGGDDDMEDSRRRKKGKGKGKAVTFQEDRDETVFEIGSDGEERRP